MGTGRGAGGGAGAGAGARGGEVTSQPRAQGNSSQWTATAVATENKSHLPGNGINIREEHPPLLAPI